jgi:hypothetical protein
MITLRRETLGSKMLLRGSASLLTRATAGFGHMRFKSNKETSDVTLKVTRGFQPAGKTGSQVKHVGGR